MSSSQPDPFVDILTPSSSKCDVFGNTVFADVLGQNEVIPK